MIEKLALWYLRKKKVQVIMNIKFLIKAEITGKASKQFYIIDNDCETLQIKTSDDNLE